MIREVISRKGNCYVLKYYKDNNYYHIDIYREHGITGNRVHFNSSYYIKNLFRLKLVLNNWTIYLEDL